MTARDIVVDHEEIRIFVLRLRDLAGRIAQTIDTGTDQIMADLVAEASQATVTGQPAPIFADVLNSMDTAMGALRKNATQLVKNLNADADFLERASADARALDEDAAAGVDRIGVGEVLGGLQRDGMSYGPVPVTHQRDRMWRPTDY